MNDSQDDDLVNWDSHPQDVKPAGSNNQRAVSEDVVWDNVEQSFDDESEVELQPLDQQVERNRMAIRESFLTVGVVRDEPADASQKYQFSLRDILIVNTVVAVLLALTQLFAPGLLAGTMGIATLIAAFLLAVYQPENRRVELAWWCMLGIYVIACVIAIYR